MLSFVPYSLPEGVSLDRVSAQAPWRAYVLHASIPDPASSNEPGQAVRRVQLEVPVAVAWSREFLAGMLVMAAAVVIGVLLPSAAHSRSYGLVAAAFALAGLVLLVRARFVLAAPDPMSLAEAITQVRLAGETRRADSLDDSLSELGEDGIRHALLRLARCGSTNEPKRETPHGLRARDLKEGSHALSLTDVTWRAQVEIRASDLKDDLERARVSALDEGIALEDSADYASAARSIAMARRIASTAPRPFTWTWLRRWASGSDVETAWSALHQAEAALMIILPADAIFARLPAIRENLSSALVGDPRLVAYLKTLDGINPSDPKTFASRQREAIRAITSVSASVSDAAHSNIRNYRNWLLIVSSVVSSALVAVAVAHAVHPNFLFIKVAHSAQGADIGEVEIAGAVGGLLMALFALIRLTIYSGPVALPLWQALVRIPAGAAAGLVGALLLQGQLLNSITPQDRSGLLAYAVLFGAAPALILRFLDQKVNEATAAARPKDDPLKTAQAQPASSP